MIAMELTAAETAAPQGPRRLLTRGIATMAGHRERFGPLPDTPARPLRGLIAESGLTGRGGAGFPTYRKLEAVAAHGRPAVVIANGAEGEPASRKDRALLIQAPHLVLDGLALAARATGADRAHLYVLAAAVPAVRAALAERADAVPVRLHVAPEAFISGEESAVVAAIAGGAALPTDKAVRITDRGLGGAPTLVQNVETLAHLALIARFGAAWFRTQGTATEPGTFLATVSGPVARPGVYEVPVGIALGDLFTAAGGETKPVRAVLIGGYHGVWVPPDVMLPLSRDALSSYGAGPGAGVVMALPAGTCGVAASARIAAYLSDQRAGQCGPCVNGLPRIAAVLGALSARTAGHAEIAELDRLAALVTGRGACRHPDGTARFVRSSLHMFAADVRAHAAGWCAAAEGSG
jgi:NADH:ubiquinone oxidoreductase subunit F (NADH-binding)